MSCSYDAERQSGSIVLSGTSVSEFQEKIANVSDQCKHLTISCSASYEPVDLAKIPASVLHLTLRKCQPSFENMQEANLQLETLALIDCRCQIWSEVGNLVAACHSLSSLEIDFLSRFGGMLQINIEQERPKLTTLCSRLHLIKNLTNLDISGCTWLTEFHLEECQQLTYLNAGKTAIKCISGLPSSLEELHIAGCTQLQSISQLKELPKISVVQAVDCDQLRVGLAELLDVIEGLQCLEYLDISRCKGFVETDSKTVQKILKKMMSVNPYVLVSEQISGVELTQDQQLSLKLKRISREGQKQLKQLQKQLEDQMQNLTDQTWSLTEKVNAELERGELLNAQLASTCETTSTAGK